MKLDKRKCRKSAAPGLNMQPDNGILHAGQVAYIVRTATKIIDHHRTLILYIYPREQAAQGDSRPRWTMFHCKDDFLTLARNKGGSTSWRTAAFSTLDGGWDFSKKCAFYSYQDEKRVSRYFRCSTGNGFSPLTSAQAAIQECRRQKRQIGREKRIIKRMSGISALPQGLKGWIHRTLMPAYFFYDYKRGGNDVPGVCSSCGSEILLSSVKQGRKGICPHCGRELTMKPRSRRGYMADRSTCQVIQNTGDGGLVVRIIKVHYRYASDLPSIQIYENARHFIRQADDGKIHSEDYYYSYESGLSTNWKKGNRPVFSQWQYNFESDTCGHLYCRNLPEAFTGTPWQYCPIPAFYGHFQEPMQALPFLAAHLEHPRLEHLVKTGFYNIAFDLAYRYGGNCLDESKNRTHRILRIAAEDVPFLRELEADLPTLRIFQGYGGLRGRQELLLWQLEHDITHDILPILRHITPHKATRYLDSQYGFLCLRRTPYGAQRYSSMQNLVSEYRDYLEICEKLNYDLKNSFVLYPKDLQKSHDKAARRLKHKEDTQIKRDFAAVYRRITGQLDFEKNGMEIAYPATVDDIIAEGHALHHCVGSYVDRVVRQECIILFLRQCSDPSRPYYTMEIRGRKAIQVRGMKNCGMTPEVQDFVSAWEQRVLTACTPEAAA